MRRTQIYLSDDECRGLQAMAQQSGRTQSALIREAIDAYLQARQPQERRACLRRGRGLWLERRDLPDWSALRRELDRTGEAAGP